MVQLLSQQRSPGKWKSMTLLKTRMSLILVLSFAPLSLFGADPPPPTKDLERITVKPPAEDFEYPSWWPIDDGWTGGFDRGFGGGGGGASPNDTAKEQETDDRKSKCDEVKGNPVVLYTGNKIEPELDFASQGEMGLFLQRTYNHHWSATGLFGNHWLSNFDYSLTFSNNDSLAWAQRPDGRRIKFIFDANLNRWNEEKAQAVAYLIRNADGSFSLHNEQRGIEVYNAEGYITRRSNQQGVAWTFAYQGQYLQKVTHASGRTVQFGWNNGQLTQVTDPAGSVYQYSYTANVFGTGRGRLASTTLPGTPSTTITYHYEDARFPGAFTGKSFNGVRYSTFAYDANKRATLSEHVGGVERYTFSYSVQSTEQVIPAPAPARPGGIRENEETGWCEYKSGSGRICYAPRSLPGGPVTVPLGNSINATTTLVTTGTKERPIKIKTTETSPLGRRTTYAFEDGKQVSVTGDTSPRCPASYKERSYDANGYPDLVSDFADNLTDFDYSAQGFLLKQVEAVGSSAERTSVFEWDAAANRLLKATVVGDRETTYTYEGRGNIAAITVRNLSNHGVPNQTRTTTYAYGYHANGLKSSITMDGPLGQDQITSTFNAQGDLVSVSNALGHATTYTGHNGRGVPNRVIGANGEVTEFTFDARGRVLTRRTAIGNGWATTQQSYDATGNTASVTQPDGRIVRYEYDAARRLLNEVIPQGDGTYAWKRYTYDAASNITRTEVAHTDHPLDSTIAGMIDEVGHDAQWNWFARGWACSTGSASSIQVDGYAEGGVYLGSTQANLASESQVAAACQSSGSTYRYQLPITLAHRQQLGGRKVTLYGLSPKGSQHNRALGNSNAFAIPTATIIGDVAGVANDVNWNFSVQGWACSVGVNAATTVHIYAGGPAGGGTYLGSATGTLMPNEDVKAACQSQGAYWFVFALDTNMRNAHGGKPLYVHGISPSGQAHLLINRSGTFAVPAVVRSAEFVGFTASRTHIFNGEESTLTAQVRNTGNVVWDGNTYLAWGQDQLNESRALSGPVPPGGIATFNMDVAPYHNGSGSWGYSYIARMATSGVGWGPQPYTTIWVENVDWYCPPNAHYCEEPK
jgi:YD repeat-containing protein